MNASLNESSGASPSRPTPDPLSTSCALIGYGYSTRLIGSKRLSFGAHVFCWSNQHICLVKLPVFLARRSMIVAAVQEGNERMAYEAVIAPCDHVSCKPYRRKPIARLEPAEIRDVFERACRAFTTHDQQAIQHPCDPTGDLDHLARSSLPTWRQNLPVYIASAIILLLLLVSTLTH